MSLSSISIRRPVFSTVLALTILIFGVMGLVNLGVREYPLAERPIISVRAEYAGAGATVIENQITEPLEEQINTVDGIRSLTSVSREGRATLTVEFELGDDLDRAANDVRDRVAAAMRFLPPDADPPVVEKADADADPIVFLNINSRERDLLELTDIADNLFKPRFETIEGVGRVDIWGSKEYAMRLWMDPARLAAYGLSANDVRIALESANVELPSGRVEGDFIDLVVRSLSRLGDDPELFNNLIITREGDRVVRFRDIGWAEIGPLEERTVLKRNQVPMVGVVLRPQSGANQIAIMDAFYERLEQIKPELPEDIELGIGFDTSDYIRNSIAEVRQTLFLAMLLVCLTIYGFLREVRSAIIPLITIPIALIGGFFILYIAGFTLNVLTLLALVLAVGLVVDDAVIVLENIYRKIEDGMEPYEAGVAGIQEIFLAVIATTLALVAVFAPIVFLGGLTGVLFREFGVALAGVVVISSFIALTFTPMLCVKILRKHEKMPRLYRATEPFFEGLNASYRTSLRAFLRFRWAAFAVMFVCVATIVGIWRVLPEELAPLEDRGLLVLQASGPQGTNYDYMTEVMDHVDAIVTERAPDVEAILTVTSPGFGAATTVNTGFSRLVLAPADKRDRTQARIAAQLSRDLLDVPGAEIFVRQPATIRTGGRRGLPVQLVVQNPDFAKIEAVMGEFISAARQRPELGFVDVDLKFNQPELVVDIDRNRAESLGVPVAAIARTLQAALSGQRFGFFLRDGRQYEIIGQLDRAGRDEPLDLTRLNVRTDGGRLISLDNLVTFSETVAPPVRYRFNRFASATFSANPADGYTLADGIAAMRAVAAEVLDDTFTTELAGESREFADAGQDLVFVFVLALVLVYLVLAAQFESFRAPFIIMLTVPLALSGGVLALWSWGLTLNLFSQIGLIMLVGLVTKNGILLVEFANQRRDAGRSLMDAITDAAAARFRPILMTTTSTILGILPVALALGAGAQSRIPLGVAVIGGLALGSFLTLYIIPAAYLFFASTKARQ